MLTDDDRIRLAVKSGGTMLGPNERERCTRHKRRWILFRWTWDVPADGETHVENLEGGGEPEIVRGCAECNKETNDD